MKLKYYLRGLGIGIIITTIILTISYSNRKSELTDEEIIQRAEELGMVMEEDSLFPFGNKESSTEVQTEEVQSEADSTTEIQQTEYMESSEPEEDAEQTTDNQTRTDMEVYRLTIFPGSVLQDISSELEESGVIEDGYALRVYLTEKGYATLLKVGAYEIPYGASQEDIYKILRDGPL